MEYCVDTRSKKKKAFIEGIMPSLINQLNLTNCKKPVLIKFDKNCDHSGQTAFIDIFDAYVILLKPDDLLSIGVTLAHEMVHVKQMSKGYLRINKEIVHWCGKKYKKDMKYLDQPWELDAFAKQEILFRRAMEE